MSLFYFLLAVIIQILLLNRFLTGHDVAQVLVHYENLVGMIFLVINKGISCYIEKFGFTSPYEMTHLRKVGSSLICQLLNEKASAVTIIDAVRSSKWS